MWGHRGAKVRGSPLCTLVKRTLYPTCGMLASPKLESVKAVITGRAVFEILCFSLSQSCNIASFLTPIFKKHALGRIRTVTVRMLRETTSPSHQEACTSLLDSLIHQRADSRSKKNYNPAARATKTTFTER